MLLVLLTLSFVSQYFSQLFQSSFLRLNAAAISKGCIAGIWILIPYLKSFCSKFCFILFSKSWNNFLTQKQYQVLPQLVC